jgi:hypothetical protein
MAKVLTEQVSLWPSSGISYVGDGAPLSSMLAFGQPRYLNNLAAAIDPCHQFAFDASYPNALGTSFSLGGSQPTSGTAFLGQVPILLPIGAKRLMSTIGLTRQTTAVDTLVSVHIGNLQMYLTPNPLNRLASDGTFQPIFGVDQTYALRTVTVGATSTGNQDYTLVDDTTDGWTGYYGSTWVRDADSSPWAYLVITCTCSNGTHAAVDTIAVRELSIWGAYE